jgi:hypothetical protein
MEKSGWKTVDLTTAKIHAHSKVEWVDNYGRKQSGKVKQLMGDYISIMGEDGSTHILQSSLVKKRIVI